MKSHQGTASVETAQSQRLQWRTSASGLTDKFGADINTKPENVIRIGCKNIHGFPHPHSQPVKYDTLREESGEYGFSFDLQSFVETNRRWNKVHHTQQLRELTKGWWDRPSFQLSWLRDSETDPMQFGGVATITNKYITSCKFKQAADPMGRWTWTTLRGKRGIKTTIISAYRPCKSSNDQSVETQQLQYLRNTGDITDPHTKFDDDLQQLITDKLNEEHRIILMGDFNVPVNRKNKFTDMLKNLGLREILTDKYKPEHDRSTYKHGSTIIDGIWATDNIELVQGGYEDLLSPSGDHCWIWADLSIDSILGNKLDPFTKPITRKVNCKVPRVKEKFQQVLEQEYTRHRLHERLESYIEKYTAEYAKTGILTEEMKYEYDKLHQLSENSIKHADKNCKKARTGAVPFSPTTKKLQGEVVMWKSILRYKSKRKKNLRLVLRQSKRWGFRHKWGPLSIAEVKEKLNLSKIQYKRFKPSAAETRKTFLGQLAQDYADRDEGGKDKEHFLRQLIHHEDEKASFQRIGSVLKPARSSVTRVERENEDGSRTIICDKEAMEKEIADANIAKLLQADNTPLRQEPLCSVFGEYGDFKKWKAIVDGTLNLPPDFPAEQGTILWIQKIQNMKTSANPTTWTPDEYTEGWKRMKEHTTSAPGPAFSHYKAVAAGSKAASVHSNLGLAPLLLGFAPTAWCRAVAAMIPKKKEDFRPAKLRLITLMHALFNHNNKWVGKQMMRYGEKNNLLAKEQYGGRKKKSAGQHALNKRLILDYIRLQKLSAILIANDARSCYDRIIIMVSFITMLNFGIMKETAQCLLSCLIGMVYAIRTIFGDSTYTYGGKKWPRTPHGNGQGNGSGPALWNGISSPLFDILREQNYGVHLKAPISEHSLHITGFGFVDDADLIQGAEKGQKIIDLLRKSQGMLTLWEEILRVTGGALDIKDKSDWTMISYKWKKGIATLRPLNPDNTLTVRDHEDDNVIMKQLPATQARETLGVMQAPSGDENPEVQYLQKKLQTWISKIRSSPLQRHDIRKATKMTIMRTLRYGLIATALSFDQCDVLTKQLIQGVLPKMGIIRTANSALATTPSNMRGVGIIHLYILQLVDHLKVICDHGNEQTETGKLLKNGLEALQLQSGLGGSPFNIDPNRCPWMEHCWWSNTLTAMHQYNVQIKGITKELQKWTTNDSFLMEDFLDYYDPRTNKNFLQSINRVRLFLQLTTRSDIQLACGWRCNPALFNQPPMPFQCLSKNAYIWPEQGRPTKRDFHNWIIALEEVYGITSINQTFRPSDRGVSWTSHRQNYHTWRIDTRRSRLFQFNESLKLWFRWDQVASGRTRSTSNIFKRTHITSEHINESYKIASVRPQGPNIQLISIGSFQSGTDSDQNTNDWAIQYLTLPEDGGYSFAQQVQLHKGQTAGDGSCKDGRATGGFITFEDDNIEGGIQGAIEVPLTEDDSTPYSGELGGIQVAIATTHHICKQHDVQTGTITHGVDNNAALRNCFGPEEPDTSTPCFHMVKRIRNEIKQSPFTWIGKKVKAHQDDDKNYEDLDSWAKANVIADKVAKNHLKRIQNKPRQIHHMKESEGWTVALNGSTVTSKFEKKIIAHCTETTAKQYWYKRMGIQEQAQENMDWVVFQKTNKNMSPNKHLFILKHSAGIAATGRNMVRRQERTTSECPRCGKNDEHIEHIILCPQNEAAVRFNKAVEELEEWLDTSTSDEIKEAVIDLILEYRKAPEQTDDSDNDDEDTNASKIIKRNQKEIGLHAFMCGFLCNDWVKQQTIYFQKKGSRKCPKNWAAQLAEQLIDIVFNMWVHRNDTLHNQTNTITEQKHEEMNRTIETLYSDLPPMRLLTHTEQRFFKHATIQQIQERTIHRKGQWIRKAQSILHTFEASNEQGRFGDTQILFRAMGITTTHTATTEITKNRNIRSASHQHNKPKTKQKTKNNTKNNTKNYMSEQTHTQEKRQFKDSG